MLQHPSLRDSFSLHEQPITVLLQISLRNRADLFDQPGHPTIKHRTTPYEAISPAGGSAVPLAAYLGTISSVPSMVTLLAWVPVSPSRR
ncbi:hypothetical protein E2C01_050372 [Portunus trituberculatus]|uniref:Uncharacterized protein n=1 Tax=Portunus trituberculatus TaxID=210409 RepID=A0A5B7G8S4_PORTR|nr:hypothetical protein [Portunus trituberculatus]